MERYIPTKSRRAAARAPWSLAPHSGIALRDPSLPTPTIDRTAQDRIGRELRAMYADFERQPIPQRVLDCIAKLEEAKG